MTGIPTFSYTSTSKPLMSELPEAWKSLPVYAIIRSTPPPPSLPHAGGRHPVLRLNFPLIFSKQQHVITRQYLKWITFCLIISNFLWRKWGKSKISMPLLLASSLRTQKYCFSPSGWREASTANLSSFVRVRRLSRLWFQRHDKLKRESSLLGC